MAPIYGIITAAIKYPNGHVACETFQTDMTKDMEPHGAFQAFRPHFDALARVAYYKNVLKSISPRNLALHNAYRVFVWICVLTYNFQHVARVYVYRKSVDAVVDTLFILLTTINSMGKQFAFNIKSSKVDHIVSVVDGPIFAPQNQYHVDVMKRNAREMSVLLTVSHVGVLSCGILWTIFPAVNKLLGDDVQFTAYFPFDTSQSMIFSIIQIYMSILIAVQAYGNVTMDCTIVAFYAQVRTQLQMLRFNLEHLADFDETKIDTIRTQSNGSIVYKDVVNRERMQTRLVRCVKHYQLIVWFCNEIEIIFGEAMVVMVLVTAWVICMTMYKIVKLSILSVEFLSMVVYLLCMLSQFFIYCFYGTQVIVESEHINESLYSCDWLALTPRFRKQLLVMMQYCTRPLAPRTAYIIPMSLETYISVLRFSYTLFTFLNRK